MSGALPFIMIGYDGDLRVTLQQDGQPLLGYVATAQADTDLPYLGDDDTVDPATLAQARILIAIDPPGAREALVARYREFQVSGFVSPRASVAPSARIESTAIVQAGCLISERVQVGHGVKINLDARLHHHTRVGAFSVVAPGARLLGAVTVGAGCYIGAAATVRQKLSVGDGSLVGMGAVVVSDIPAGVVAYGTPATPRRKI